MTIRVYRMPFYIPRNPRTEKQQANRQKFADAMADWKLLPDPEKESWREEAKGKPLYGSNLFVREYYLTH